MQIQLTSDNVGSSRHLRIPQNIHLYAENLRNGNSAKYFTHYAIPQIINIRVLLEIALNAGNVVLEGAVAFCRQDAAGPCISEMRLADPPRPSSASTFGHQAAALLVAAALWARPCPGRRGLPT